MIQALLHGFLSLISMFYCISSVVQANLQMLLEISELMPILRVPVA
jgi:hypothetical protein